MKLIFSILTFKFLVCTIFAIDDIQSILPKFEIGRTNILFENLVQNADQVKEFKTLNEVKYLDYLKNSIFKIPSEDSFVIRQDLEDSLNNPSFSTKSFDNNTVIEQGIFSKIHKFNQYIFKNPGSRIKMERYGCIPNNSSLTSSYAFERTFSMSTNLQMAANFAYIFGFVPKLGVGFTKGGGIKFEVTCNVEPGNCIQLQKRYTEYYWKDVQRREIIVSSGTIRDHKIEYKHYETLPESTMIDKSSLHFSCVTFPTDDYEDTEQSATEDSLELSLNDMVVQ